MFEYLKQLSSQELLTALAISCITLCILFVLIVKAIFSRHKGE